MYNVMGLLTGGDSNLAAVSSVFACGHPLHAGHAGRRRYRVRGPGAPGSDHHERTEVCYCRMLHVYLKISATATRLPLLPPVILVLLLYCILSSSSQLPLYHLRFNITPRSNYQMVMGLQYC